MANKIRYSVSGHKATIGKNAGRVLYRPNRQVNGVMDLPQLAQHMSEHDSKYNEGDIYAVLVQAVKCIKEQVQNGVKVRLADLGAFEARFRTTAQTAAEDVSAEDIRTVTLKWTTGLRFKNFRDDCDFELVPTRKNQALLVQAEKSGQTTMALAERSSGSDSGTGGGNQAGGE